MRTTEASQGWTLLESTITTFISTLLLTVILQWLLFNSRVSHEIAVKSQQLSQIQLVDALFYRWRNVGWQTRIENDSLILSSPVDEEEEWQLQVKTSPFGGRALYLQRDEVGGEVVFGVESLQCSEACLAITCVLTFKLGRSARYVYPKGASSRGYPAGDINDPATHCDDD